LESLVAIDDDMMKQMGFAGFDTTKNKKVEDNVDGMAKVNKTRKYRQVTIIFYIIVYFGAIFKHWRQSRC
jgi:hypothetical protein